MRVTAFDHLVINVADVRRSLDFYVGTLGLQPERVAEWEAGEVFFPSVRVDEHTVLDLMELPRDGQNTDHFCLVVEDDVDAIAAAGELDVVDGPADRWGARGVARSIYVKDPDGNTVELRRYPAGPRPA